MKRYSKAIAATVTAAAAWLAAVGVFDMAAVEVVSSGLVAALNPILVYFFSNE